MGNSNKGNNNALGFWIAVISIFLAAFGFFADAVDLGLFPSPGEIIPTTDPDAQIVLTNDTISNSFGARPEATATPRRVATSAPTAIPNDCPLPPRLAIGDEGRVLPDPPTANLIREAPDSSSRATERIEINRTYTVLDGPICADDINWWYVRSYEGAEGWTAEGADYEYFVERLD